QIFYNFSATPIPSEHGIFFSPSPGLDTTANRIQGTLNGNYFASVDGLLPGTTYYALPYMIVNGRYYIGEEKAVATFSDYSTFPVNTDPFSVGHKIVWNDPTSARKISPEGYFADYGRIKRIGNTDTLILVYQGGPNNGDWVNVCMRMSYDNGNTWSEQKITSTNTGGSVLRKCWFLRTDGFLLPMKQMQNPMKTKAQSRFF
ncbi:MAG TPA: hypothetical protein PK825_05290, partial [Bacteroidales bacterium]|nr:hypothetical protein [Bacteroidales bacterium]